MQGTADRIVDAQAAVALAGRLSGDVTLKTWDGYCHIAWVNAHTQIAGTAAQRKYS